MLPRGDVVTPRGGRPRAWRRPRRAGRAPFDRPVLAHLGGGPEPGPVPVEPFQAADQTDLPRQGAGQHGLAEAPDRVGEHGGAVPGHAGDQLDLGLHDLVEADPGRVGVEEQQVVLRVVDGRHPDEAVRVADPLQTPELAEPRRPARARVSVTLRAHFTRGLTTLSCDAHHTTRARRHPEPLLRPHPADRALRAGRRRAAVRRRGHHRRQGRQRLPRDRRPRRARGPAGPGRGRRPRELHRPGGAGGAPACTPWPSRVPCARPRSSSRTPAAPPC